MIVGYIYIYVFILIYKLIGSYSGLVLQFMMLLFYVITCSFCCSFEICFVDNWMCRTKIG